MGNDNHKDDIISKDEFQFATEMLTATLFDICYSMKTVLADIRGNALACLSLIRLHPEDLYKPPKDVFDAIQPTFLLLEDGATEQAIQDEIGLNSADVASIVHRLKWAFAQEDYHHLQQFDMFRHYYAQIDQHSLDHAHIEEYMAIQPSETPIMGGKNAASLITMRNKILAQSICETCNQLNILYIEQAKYRIQFRKKILNCKTMVHKMLMNVLKNAHTAWRDSVEGYVKMHEDHAAHAQHFQKDVDWNFVQQILGIEEDEESENINNDDDTRNKRYDASADRSPLQDMMLVASKTFSHIKKYINIFMQVVNPQNDALYNSVKAWKDMFAFVDKAARKCRKFTKLVPDDLLVEWNEKYMNTGIFNDIPYPLLELDINPDLFVMDGNNDSREDIKALILKLIDMNKELFLFSNDVGDDLQDDISKMIKGIYSVIDAIKKRHKNLFSQR